MILWLTGKRDSGKTTQAELWRLASPNTIVLDADEMRVVWKDLRYTEDDRMENNLRLARLANKLELQGFNIIVASVCPSRKIQEAVREACHCQFIHVTGGWLWEGTTYEPPGTPMLKVSGNG